MSVTASSCSSATREGKDILTLPSDLYSPSTVECNLCVLYIFRQKTKDDKRFSFGEFSNEVEAMKKMFTDGKKNFQSSLSLKFIPTEAQINTSIELSPGLSVSANANITRFLKQFSERVS